MEKKRYSKYYEANAHFRIENPNPRWAQKRGLVWDTPDCVIRAVAIAISCTWLEAFDYLTAKARAEFTVPSDGTRLRKWLEDGGAIWHHCKAEKGKKRMTVKEFAEKHPKGRYIISIANHECACVDGIVMDAWNPGDKAVVGYLDMVNFKL